MNIVRLALSETNMNPFLFWPFIGFLISLFCFLVLIFKQNACLLSLTPTRRLGKIFVRLVKLLGHNGRGYEA
jgi:hypothetical protein